MNEFNMLFESFRSVFTAPSFIHFQVLMVSLWALPLITGGPVSLARIWLASRSSHHWDGLLRFVRRYRWQPDELAKALTLLVLSTVRDHLPIGADGRPWLLLGVDETSDEHPTAKKTFGVSKHYHPSARVGQSKYRLGHCWLTVSLLIDVSSDYVRSLAVNIALYIARKSCRPTDYQSKRELATQMLDKLAEWRGPGYRIVVVGDAYYACREWIARQRESSRRVVTRLRADANVRQLPRRPRRARPGRPRRYGPRIDLKRRARSEHKFEPEVEVTVYGRRHHVRLRKLVCLWYGLADPVSVVIVRGIGKKTVYLLDTDPTAPAIETLSFYAARHAVEQPYEDLKCDGGLGHYRGRTERGVRRFALLAVVSHTLLRLIELEPRLRAFLPALDEPWRKQLSHLTCGQIRMAVAKLLLDHYAQTGNFFDFDLDARHDDNSHSTVAALKKAA
jgi:hypothetical protein